jgi:hypothetical protein
MLPSVMRIGGERGHHGGDLKMRFAHQPLLAIFPQCLNIADRDFPRDLAM